jgi:hypothetical protein
MPDKVDGRRTFSVSFPAEEARAILEAADSQNISITMLFRMWVRETLMEDPIRIPAKQ